MSKGWNEVEQYTDSKLYAISYCALFKGSKAKDSTVYQWSGPRLHNLWSIIEDDQLVADWPTDEGGNYCLSLQASNLLTESVEGQWTLQPVIYSVDRRLYMAIDAAAFAKGSEEEFYKLAVGVLRIDSLGDTSYRSVTIHVRFSDGK